jgi:hypothetical protein
MLSIQAEHLMLAVRFWNPAGVFIIYFSYEQLENCFSADVAHAPGDWSGQLFWRTKWNDPWLRHSRGNKFYFVLFL